MFQTHRLVNQIFNMCFGTFIVPAVIGIGGFFWIKSIYVVTMTWNSSPRSIYMRNVFVVAGNTCIGLGFTSLAGSIFTLTVQILEFWRNRAKTFDKQTRRARKSLQPFGIHVGQFYVMSYVNRNTYVRIVFENTINALLTFR